MFALLSDAALRLRGLPRFAIVAVLLASCAKPKPPGPQPPLQQAPATAVASSLALVANGGGCYLASAQPDGGTDYSEMNPPWVPVEKGSATASLPILVTGSVVSAHGDIGGGFPANHASSDVVAELALGSGEGGFAASGNPPATLALEWESGALATYAWPSPGDQVTALGRWVFDCQSPNATAGTCSASASTACFQNSDCGSGTCMGAQVQYNSQMHPPYALAVTRSNRGEVVSDLNGTAPTLATRTDVFVSPNGGAAGDTCIGTHDPSATDFLDTHNCFPLSLPVVAPYFNTWDFDFDIPLPPRPGLANPSWTVNNQALGNIAFPANIVLTPYPNGSTPHLHASVKLSQSVSGALPTGFAATVFAGWSAPSPQPLKHVQVTLQNVTIVNPLHPLVPVVRAVKDWVMTMSANGEAQPLAGLGAVGVGAVTQSLQWDEYLPATGSLHIHAEGTAHTCVDTLFGKSLATDLTELPPSDAGPVDFDTCMSSIDANPGVVDVTYPGPTFGAGTISVPSVGGSGGVCSIGSGTPCLTDADCIPPPLPTDAGMGDAGPVDGGTTDAGSSDAGVTDGGVSDAGVSDAGVSDAGITDAGTTDGGTSDAGTGDAGQDDDAGVIDAGPLDAGPIDAGSPDAGDVCVPQAGAYSLQYTITIVP